jgi:hypothetical protein
MTITNLDAGGPGDATPDTTGEDASGAAGPMVGIAIRLPVATLDAARAIALGEGVKVTAMLREWIDQRVAERVDDERVVSVADLRRLIAHRARDAQTVPEAPAGEPGVIAGKPARKSASGGTKPKVKAGSGKSTKAKAKSSRHGTAKAD